MLIDLHANYHVEYEIEVRFFLQHLGELYLEICVWQPQPYKKHVHADDSEMNPPPTFDSAGHSPQQDGRQALRVNHFEHAASSDSYEPDSRDAACVACVARQAATTFSPLRMTELIISCPSYKTTEVKFLHSQHYWCRNGGKEARKSILLLALPR